MLALLAMAGLALDTAHVLLNKSRLQSALDAAALAAAKALSQSTNTTWADTAAKHCLYAECHAISRVADGRDGRLDVDRLSTLPHYHPVQCRDVTRGVRARLPSRDLRRKMSLISALGITSMNVAGSARRQARVRP